MLPRIASPPCCVSGLRLSLHVSARRGHLLPVAPYEKCILLMTTKAGKHDVWMRAQAEHICRRGFWGLLLLLQL